MDFFSLSILRLPSSVSAIRCGAVCGSFADPTEIFRRLKPLAKGAGWRFSKF
jgi:hypothetical protein